MRSTPPPVFAISLQEAAASIGISLNSAVGVLPRQVNSTRSDLAVVELSRFRLWKN